MFFSSDWICGRFLSPLNELWQIILKHNKDKTFSSWRETWKRRDIYKAAVQFETKHLKSTLKNFHYLNSSVLNVWFNPNMSFKVWYRYSYYSSHYLIFLNVKNEIIQLFFSCEGKKLQRNVTQYFFSNFVCVKSCFINNIMLQC